MPLTVGLWPASRSFMSIKHVDFALESGQVVMNVHITDFEAAQGDFERIQNGLAGVSFNGKPIEVRAVEV